jgi:hypothetical protein
MYVPAGVRIPPWHTPETLAAAEARWADATDHELRLVFAALMLSGGKLTICEALLRGEHVPVDRLDPEWAERYGLV